MIDCHAHLADPVFDADRGEVLARARAAGVTGVVTVGETLDDARRILELASRHAELLPAAGLYPTYLDPEQAVRIEALIREQRGRLVAIGEVGLDYWKVKKEPDREIQREIFARFVRLSLELDLLDTHQLVPDAALDGRQQMDLAGTQITSTAAVSEGAPTWAPDGQRIAFVIGDEPAPNENIYLCDTTIPEDCGADSPIILKDGFESTSE